MNLRSFFRFPLMEEAGGGGTGGGAAPAAAPAPAGAPAAPAPASATVNAPAAPAAAPAAAAPGTLPQGHPALSWLPANVDQDLLTTAQHKGWQTAVDAVKSYRDLEKMLGADRAGRTVTIPADESDAAAWNQVYDRLGRPANAEGYQLPVPEGQPPEFAKMAAAEFYKLGVSAKTGKALAEWWNQQGQRVMEAEQLANEQKLVAENEQLRKDWGNEFDMRRELTRRAMLELGTKSGVDRAKLETAIDTLEKTAGYSAVFKLFAAAGDMMREHGAEGLGGQTNMGSFAMTPEGARTRKGQLMADADWRKRAMNPQSAEWAELQKLDRIITT